ncbi:hypothetical protein KIN20_024702 [Parelaphostrongylus tenuis]|uniref:Uncharacterized protein n=1 Tax=Parelaphostrongylus tenuis TaxID=148309 RepID=A0AAD5MTW1_PARTN|nr:hypothetical protein KIN20_024702 [Parelaphostrongylus tenuis]
MLITPLKNRLPPREEVSSVDDGSGITLYREELTHKVRSPHLDESLAIANGVFLSELPITFPAWVLGLSE